MFSLLPIPLRIRPPRRRWRVAGALLLAAAILAPFLRPAPAHAACGVMDVDACLDGVEYSLWHGVASFLWTGLRTMLQMTYQIDQFRSWLVTVAFSGAYEAIVGIVEPAYAPLATIALLLAVLAMMLVPLTGMRGLSIRHVLTWAVLTPILVAVIGQGIAQAEALRVSVGSAMATQAAGATPGAIFGPSGSDMAPVVPLYPANPCGIGTLVRPDPVAITLDDLAAALLYADASDIWCPDARGPSRDIPDGFFADPPLYAVDANVGDLTNPVERTNAISGIQRGVARLLLGFLPALLAIVAAATNLIFALSLIALWLMVPIALLVVFFQQHAAVVTSMLPSLVRTFQVSWGCMVLMGALAGALGSAAASGNAAAYAGFAVCALFIQGYLMLVAFRTLGTNLMTLDRTVQSVTGLSAAEPVQMAARATTTAAAAATGMGAVALAAQHASRDMDLRDQASYVSSAMLGRLPGVAQVGEVSAAMGLLDPESPGYRGARAGELSTGNWRWARLQMESDRRALLPAAAEAADERDHGSSGAAGDDPAWDEPGGAPRPGRPDGSGGAETPIALTDTERMSRQRGALHLRDGAVVVERRRSAAELSQLGATIFAIETVAPADLLAGGQRIQFDQASDAVYAWNEPDAPVVPNPAPAAATSAAAAASAAAVTPAAVPTSTPAVVAPAVPLPPLPPVVPLPRLQVLLEADDPRMRQALRYDPATGLTTSEPHSEAELAAAGVRVTPIADVNLEGMLRSGYQVQVLFDADGAPRAVADWGGALRAAPAPDNTTSAALKGAPDQQQAWMSEAERRAETEAATVARETHDMLEAQQATRVETRVSADEAAGAPHATASPRAHDAADAPPAPAPTTAPLASPPTTMSTPPAAPPAPAPAPTTAPQASPPAPAPTSPSAPASPAPTTVPLASPPAPAPTSPSAPASPAPTTVPPASPPAPAPLASPSAPPPSPAAPVPPPAPSSRSFEAWLLSERFDPSVMLYALDRPAYAAVVHDLGTVPTGDAAAAERAAAVAILEQHVAAAVAAEQEAHARADATAADEEAQRAARLRTIIAGYQPAPRADEGGAA